MEPSTSQQPQGEAAEGLMTEVTSLLKSLRMHPPQLRAYQVRKLEEENHRDFFLTEEQLIVFVLQRMIENGEKEYQLACSLLLETWI